MFPGLKGMQNKQDRDSRQARRNWQRDDRIFEKRVRFVDEEAVARERLGLDDKRELPIYSHREMKRRRQRETRRMMWDKPSVGTMVAQYLGDARDRSRFTMAAERGKPFGYAKNDVCVPDTADGNNIFRTIPDPITGCAPFTNTDRECCVQDDLQFLAAVAALIGDAEVDCPRGCRIEKEIFLWMSTVNPQIVATRQPVEVDTSTPRGMALFELAAHIVTSCSIVLLVREPNQVLHRPRLDFLVGDVNVRAMAGSAATLSFESLLFIITDNCLSSELTIDCPVEMNAATGVHELTQTIDSVDYQHSSKIRFVLPDDIPVQTVMQELVENHADWSYMFEGTAILKQVMILNNHHEMITCKNYWIRWDVVPNRIMLDFDVNEYDPPQP